MSLLFNTGSIFVIYFPPGSKFLLIPCLQSPFRVIWEPKKIKSVRVHILSFYLPSHDGNRHSGFGLLNVEFSARFLLSSFILIQTVSSSSSLSFFTGLPSAYLRLFKLIPEILIPAYYSSSLAFGRV